MSRREYKTINRRMQRGRLSSINEGKYVGSIAPFGYNKIKLENDKGFTLKENDEGRVIKLIFDMYVNKNLSINKICIKLNELKIKPRRNKKWSVSSIKEILSNPVYIGKVRWDTRKQIKTPKNGKLIVIRPRNETPIIKDGIHKPIIDIKTWEIAREKRKLNSVPIHKSNSIKNPLASIIICKKCGKLMQRRPYKSVDKQDVLICNNPECNNISSKLEIIEKKINWALNKYLENSYIEIEEDGIKDSNDNILEKELVNLKKKLELENKKLDNIYDAFENAIYTKEMFLNRRYFVNDNIKEMKEGIYRYINEIKENEKELNNYYKNIKDNKIKIMDIYNNLENPEEKNEFLKLIIDKVVYLKEKKSTKNSSSNFQINIYPKI